MQMKSMPTANRLSALLVASLVVSCAVLAAAADRIREGQWETTVTVMGRTMTSSDCMSKSDAAAMNGDVASIRTLVERKNATNGCKVTNVTINRDQVAVTSVCAGLESVTTTTYKGDTFEGVDTNGMKVQARRVGACK